MSKDKATQEWCVEVRRLLDLWRPEGSSVQDAKTAAAQAAAQASFAQRLKAVLTAAKATSAQLGAAAVRDVAQQAAAAQAAAKIGDLDQANMLLAGLEAVGNGPAADVGATAPQDESADNGERRIRDRMSANQARIAQTRDAGGPAAGELRGLLRILDAQLAAGEFERAAALLDRIERLLADAAQERAQFRRRLTALADGVQSSEQEVAGQISALAQALKVSDDAELRLIGEAGLDWILGDHGERLRALVAEVVQAEPAARSGAADRALQCVGGYLDHLESSEEIAACDRNDLGIAVAIRGTLGFALQAIGEALAEV